MNGSGSTLGDLVRGLAALSPGDDATRECIAQMISVSPPRPAPVSGDRAQTKPKDARADEKPSRSPPVDSLLPSEAELSSEPVACRLQLREQLPPPKLPAWWDKVDVMPPADWGAAKAPVPSLLHPSRQRALIGELCATRCESDEIDLERLSDQLAACRVVERIPFRQRKTLRHGVIVLFDHVLGMAPYRKDLNQVERLVRSILPDDQIQIGRFQGVPGRNQLLDDVRWVGGKRHGSAERPLLILSDLSMGGPLEDEGRVAVYEWDEYLRRAVGGLRPLRILVPRSRARWPVPFRRHRMLFEWSRRLTLSEIRRHISIGHGY